MMLVLPWVHMTEVMTTRWSWLTLALNTSKTLMRHILLTVLITEATIMNMSFPIWHLNTISIMIAIPMTVIQTQKRTCWKIFWKKRHCWINPSQRESQDQEEMISTWINTTRMRCHSTSTPNMSMTQNIIQMLIFLLKRTLVSHPMMLTWMRPLSIFATILRIHYSSSQ